jgi:hypothetical protein
MIQARTWVRIYEMRGLTFDYPALPGVMYIDSRARQRTPIPPNAAQMSSKFKG